MPTTTLAYSHSPKEEEKTVTQSTYSQDFQKPAFNYYNTPPSIKSRSSTTPAPSTTPLTSMQSTTSQTYLTTPSSSSRHSSPGPACYTNHCVSHNTPWPALATRPCTRRSVRLCSGSWTPACKSCSCGLSRIRWCDRRRRSGGRVGIRRGVLCTFFWFERACFVLREMSFDLWVYFLCLEGGFGCGY